LLTIRSQGGETADDAFFFAVYNIPNFTQNQSRVVFDVPNRGSAGSALHSRRFVHFLQRGSSPELSDPTSEHSTDKVLVTRDWPSNLTLAIPALAALVIGLIPVGQPDLSYDESATVSAVDRSVGEMFGLLQNVDAVHGTYYFLLHFWSNLVGPSPLALRAPSAVAVALTVVGVTILTIEIANRRAALFSGSALAVVPIAASYADLARPYGAAMCFATWATFVLWVTLSGKLRVLGWVLYCALMIALSYIFLFGLLMLLAHGICVFASSARRQRLRALVPFLISVLVVALVVSPLLLRASRQSEQVSWLQKVIMQNVLSSPTDVVVTGVRYQNPLWTLVAVALVSMAWVLIVWGAATLWMSWRNRNQQGSSSQPNPFALLVSWLLVPAVVLIVVS